MSAEHADEFDGAGCCPEEDGWLRARARERLQREAGPQTAAFYCHDCKVRVPISYRDAAQVARHVGHTCEYLFEASPPESPAEWMARMVFEERLYAEERERLRILQRPWHYRVRVKLSRAASRFAVRIDPR